MPFVGVDPRDFILSIQPLRILQTLSLRSFPLVLPQSWGIKFVHSPRLHSIYCFAPVTQSIVTSRGALSGQTASKNAYELAASGSYYR